jgi:hypothetical protein
MAMSSKGGLKYEIFSFSTVEPYLHHDYHTSIVTAMPPLPIYKHHHHHQKFLSLSLSVVV